MSIPRKVALRILRVYWWIARPVTLGVKAILIDQEQRVLLVRHTYQPGWHFPGGGVKRGEGTLEGVIREVREEVGLKLLDRPLQAYGVYANFSEYKSDHVAVFLFKSWEPIPNAPKSGEIAEWNFYPLNALPIDTTPATKRRLAEIDGSSARTYIW